MEQSSAGTGKDSAWVKQNSHLARVGLKGPQAAAWLQSRSIPIPERANSWIAITPDEQDIVVRLGATEFFLEQSQSGEQLQPLAGELASPITGVYPVLREDRAFVLGGAAADAVLAEMCNVNFSALRAAEREAVMTMMIGVAVTVVPQGSAARRRYRIWCDPSYGEYLWSSLQDVASIHK